MGGCANYLLLYDKPSENVTALKKQQHFLCVHILWVRNLGKHKRAEMDPALRLGPPLERLDGWG